MRQPRRKRRPEGVTPEQVCTPDIARRAKAEAVAAAIGDKLALADDIAVQLGVSVRTVYRHVRLAQYMGYPIRGEAGVGYVMRGAR